VPLLELPALYVDVVSATIEAARPALVNRDPGPGEPGVPLTAPIALDLVDPGPDGIDRTATRVWVGGVLAFDGSATPPVQPTFAGPRAQITEMADTLRIVLDPLAPWASLAAVTVRVVSATKGGAFALDQSYGFTAEDRTAPLLLSAQAVAPTVVRLGFSESVTVTDPGGYLFAAQGEPAVPIAAVSATAIGSQVLVTVNTAMSPDVPYHVVAIGVADLNGNALAPPHNDAVFAGFRPARPSTRRFDLWSMLPKQNRRADTTGDLARFIACLQEVTDLLLADIDGFSDLYDLERAPTPFLDLILRDLGNPFPFVLDEISKRRLAAVLVQMYQQKGTAVGIQNAIRFFLGVEVLAVTPFARTTLILGESLLGVDWELGPSDRHARYSFDLQVGVVLTPEQRSRIRAIVNYLKPAHTHFIDLAEPVPLIIPDHWMIGESELGVTSLLH
jgi:phage tail-like protein